MQASQILIDRLMGSRVPQVQTISSCSPASLKVGQHPFSWPQHGKSSHIIVLFLVALLITTIYRTDFSQTRGEFYSPPYSCWLSCHCFVSSWDVKDSVKGVHNFLCRGLIPYQTGANLPDWLEETNFAPVLNHGEIPANPCHANALTLLVEHIENIEAGQGTIAHIVVPYGFYLQSLTYLNRTK